MHSRKNFVFSYLDEMLYSPVVPEKFLVSCILNKKFVLSVLACDIIIKHENRNV